MSNPIVIYGADWCVDCRRAKNVLAALSVEFDYIEVDKDETAAAKAVEISGAKSIPVIIFPDGSHLIEPSTEVLIEAVERAGLMQKHEEQAIDFGGGD